MKTKKMESRHKFKNIKLASKSLPALYFILLNMFFTGHLHHFVGSALKADDIGVAMGVTGTDVAKDASDMVLLDDSFLTIAYAIKEGRRIYRNIQKMIQFLLVDNIAEILTLFIATLFNLDASLLAIHILCVNLDTATLPVLALDVDPASKNIMKHQPVKSGTLLKKDLVRRVITQGGLCGRYDHLRLLDRYKYWGSYCRADDGFLCAGLIPDAACV